MKSDPNANCDACPYIDHSVMIVGSNRFCAEVLGNFINTSLPAKWDSFEHLEDVPQPETSAGKPWRLIFINCLGMTNIQLVEMLKTGAVPFLKHDIVALFNLTRSNTDIPSFIDLGVRGFFFESDQADYILKGICALKNGEMWVARGALMEYVCQRPKKASPEKQTSTQLTPREKDVLVLLASGASNEEIAAKLYISPLTVKTHIYNTLKKLGVKNRLQAALWAAANLNSPTTPTP